MKSSSSIAQLIILFGICGILIAVAILYQLYRVQYDRQETSLRHLVSRQAILLELTAREVGVDFIANIKASNNNLTDDTAIANSHSDMVINQLEHGGIGETGEFMAGSRVDETIVFFLIGRHAGQQVPSAVPWEGTFGEPMRRALKGDKGFIVADDYSGVKVMAAYEPVKSLNIGLVGKLNLSEFRAPFILYGAISLGFGMLLIISGILYYQYVGKILIQELEEEADTNREIVSAKEVELQKIQVESVETKEKLEESEKKYQLIFDKSDDAMWLTVDRKFIRCNDAAVRLFGCSSIGEFRDTHTEKFSPKVQPDGSNSFDKSEELIKVAFKKGYHKFHWHHRNIGNGKIFPTDVTLTVISIQGKPAIHAMIRDITKETEHEENLNNALDAAENANIAKSDFLASMSHEFRTPLNAIIGFSELIKGQYLGPIENEKYVEYIEDIHSSGSHLLDLINDVLDISAIEAGKRPMEKTRFNFNSLIEDCLKIVNTSAEKKEIKLESLITGLDDRIYAHKKGLKQIIVNLLANSIKFTEEQGLIKLGARLNDDILSVYIEDNGIGIEEDKLPLIMEPFSRVHDNAHVAQEGSGLGLSITQKLIEAYGGDINIESKYGIGTKISFSIPVNQDVNPSIDKTFKVKEAGGNFLRSASRLN